METTVDGSESAIQSAADRVANDLKNGAKNIHAAGEVELQRLIADVEELLGRVSNLKDAKLVRVRTRIEDALASAKQSVASTTDSVKTEARRVASSADNYVRESPWQALGIAALVGIAVGLLASRRP